MILYAIYECDIMWNLYVDGASRGNPGNAGIGVYIEKNGHPYRREAFYIGQQTNNHAEYCALIVGLYYVQNACQAHELVHIYCDSQLVVKHITGEYRVKKPELKVLYLRARAMLDHIATYAIHHVPRHHNTVADTLANQAIDSYTPLPQQLEALCATRM